MELPREPMIPVSDETIPEGADWGYQLKWDGVRMLARVENGRAELFSRRLLPKSAAYPEIAEALGSIKGSFLLDGEVIVFDRTKQRPVFQHVLQRERFRSVEAIRQAGSRQPAQFIIFDVLHAEGRDLRSLPYAERHRELLRLFPEKTERYFVTDLFPDGKALWAWVEQNNWEGIVSKRLSGPYKEGKKHRDWLKKKTALLLDVTIVGYTFNEGRLASLVMALDGLYFGRVSLGLNEELKRRLLRRTFRTGQGAMPFRTLPADLQGLALAWLAEPFTCRVTGHEVTDAGLLRHSRLVSLGI